MRKTILGFILALFSLALVVGYANAGQRCDVCHTMHNSQNGIPMNFDANATPNPTLLRGACLGCHGDTTANTIKTNTAGTIPQVFNSAGGTTDPGASNSVSGATVNLAGGNFYYVKATGTAATDDPKGHNVDVITGVSGDGVLGNAPPGYASAYDPATTKYSNSFRLTCAGSNGCHGNRNTDRSGFTTGVDASLAALDGAHHEDDTPPKLDGSTVGRSYRFLNGILGLEDANWQQSASASDHNEYEGDTTQGTNTHTISYLCANCHGNFHRVIGTASPWLRHPTDTDTIGKGGGYAKYNDIVSAGNPYSIEAPVGYDGTGLQTGIPAAPRATVSTGQSIVLCLSCHRAHATPNDDILRWSYATMQAGGGGANGTGCFRCHTALDGTP
jgi:hypothetical protein